MKSPQRLQVGIDTGGTFTDFVVCDDGRLRAHKVLSDPESPDRAILRGLEELDIAHRPLAIRHGSTVATNTVLEEDGARVAYVTNRGMADVLTIGRQQRRQLYQLSIPPASPPVAPDLCFEVAARMDARGEIIDDLDDSAVAALIDALQRANPEAVAVNLLFSFLNDAHERRLATALESHWPVSLSSEVLAEIGEFERGIATWLNAYVAPRMGRYLDRLRHALPESSVSVMQSDGLTVSARQAAGRGARLLLSGPAGGLVGARTVAAAAGFERLMTLDVGGTSTDVALIDGEVQITREGRVGRFPVAVPMVDMHTVGAGGGSIASLDDQGLLHVGPRSAGANPGPASYGQGGTAPTVTDAFVLAGRLPDGATLGRGGIRLDRSAAEHAFEPLARGLDRPPADAAMAVIRLANEHMAGALRVISVERGHDPREFVLCAFGGAGGLHACELADLLGMDQVLIPIHSGVLSALGMAFSAPGREATQAVLEPLAQVGDRRIETSLGNLQAALMDQLERDHVTVHHIHRQVDLRYVGQSFTLTLPWKGVDGTRIAFHMAHRQRFGHALDFDVELVNLRVRLQGEAPDFEAEPAGGAELHPIDGALVRQQLKAGETIKGPRTILDVTGASWVAPHWQAEPDRMGNLIMKRTRPGKAGDG